MEYQCGICAVEHEHRPTCFVAALPVALSGLTDRELEQRVERSADQCILDGQHFFVLGNLDVPIRHSSEFIRWTVWSSLSKAHFDRSSELWHTVGRESEPPYFGWLGNHIPGYPSTINIKALVQTEVVGVRPRIVVVEEGHPLAIDQESGVTEQRAEELIHAALHGTA